MGVCEGVYAACVLEELELIPTSGLMPFAARPNEARGSHQIERRRKKKRRGEYE